MNKDKIVSADEAVAMIRDRDTVCTSGFVGIGTPDELLIALEKRYRETRHPSDLTLMFAAAPGDAGDRGLNRLAHDGLLKRVVGGHWALVPKLGELALANRIEAYNLPLGCISHLYRNIAARGPGVISKVGLKTFVDPRLQFAPLIRNVKPMDARIFRDGPMGLDHMLLGRGLADRISYDAERNTLFVNFEGF